MAKNIARGQNIIAKNIVPNLVGMTRSTAESILSNLGFTYTATSVNTGDSGQNDKVISQGVAADSTELLGTNIPYQYNTFSFAPFGAFNFTPAPSFSFTPFGAFTFVTFSFTPFGAFSFVTFSFTPFGAFSFVTGVSTEDQPSCIFEESLILAKRDGKVVPVKMMHIDIGDTIYSISGDNLKEESFENSIYLWNTDRLENVHLVETTVKNIHQFQHSRLVYFNNDTHAKFSLQEPILVKRNEQYEFLTAGMIQPGDFLLNYSIETDKFYEVVVDTIDFEDGEFTTYNLLTEPQNMVLVNGLVAHNK